MAWPIQPIADFDLEFSALWAISCLHLAALLRKVYLEALIGCCSSTPPLSPLASGLPATALAGLDFHQLDSFERFHPLTGIPLPQALPGAMNFISSIEVDGWRFTSRFSITD